MEDIKTTGGIFTEESRRIVLSNICMVFDCEESDIEEPYKTIEEYEEDEIKPLKLSCKKGITLIDKEDYLDKNKTDNKLSIIKYHFIQSSIFCKLSRIY